VNASELLPEERPFDSGGPSLGEIGETETLRRLITVVSENAPRGLELALGDDAALWQPTPGRQLAISQDAIVEGKDFRRHWTTPRRLGRKAVAIALSDLAGMGATPAWVLVTLCAPATTEVGDVLELQRGLSEAASAVGCAVIGGDLSDIDGPLVIDVCVGGLVEPGRALRRDSGREGDALLVTGTLGRAAAGLRVLLEGGSDSRQGPDHARWLAAQLEPQARLAEGRRLVDAGVDCGGDLSDGLLADAERLVEASGCAAELWLDAVPVDPGIREAFGGAWVEVALGGGEDFELLAAVRPEQVEGLVRLWPDALAPLHVVGRLVHGEGLRLLDRKDGSPVPLPPVRSRHFG
jgi:thiamine-monophosphate kinase